MLKAQGGRMAARKSTNFDACRDLDGRRLKTIKQAQQMAEYMAGEDERKQQALDKLSKKIDKALQGPPKKKMKFDDTEYLRESEEIVEHVKAAVQIVFQHVEDKEDKGKVVMFWEEEVEEDETQSV
jgi:hypothetical protein